MSSYTYPLRYACVHVSVSQQLTSIPFALLALSHSRDVPELPRGGGGTHTPVGGRGEPRGGNERYSPHFIHQQPHTLTQQPTMARACVCVSPGVLACVCLCTAPHIMPSKNNFAWLHKLFEISGHICTTCGGAVCSQSIRETLFSRGSGKGFDPAGPFTHPMSCSVWLLLARKVMGDTIVALIDRVNKYSSSVPVRCASPCNTLSVCFSLQSGSVTSCLPHTAFVN